MSTQQTERIVTIHNHHEGEHISFQEITDGGLRSGWLTLQEVESASRAIADDFGNVVLDIEREGGQRLFVVQSIDLDWIEGGVSW